MNKIKVVVDCDDVLFKCNSLAVEQINKQFNTSFNLTDIKSWGRQNNELDYRLDLFKDPKFVAKQTPFDGAKEFIEELGKVAEIFIATSTPTQCIDARFKSIMTNFPSIDPENIIFGRRKDLIHGDILLDDAIHNLAESKVKYPVLFQKPWNKNNSGLLSVSGYNEFLELVKTISTIHAVPEDLSYDILCIVGPSGSGKRELCKFLENTSDFKRVKTYSTKDDDFYHYLTEEDFEKESKTFFEKSMYLNNHYGIKKEDIKQVLKGFQIPILIVDINGAMTLKKMYNALLVFTKAPVERCIENILNKDISTEQKVSQLAALNTEMKNQRLCDIAYNYLEDNSQFYKGLYNKYFQ